MHRLILFLRDNDLNSKKLILALILGFS